MFAVKPQKHVCILEISFTETFSSPSRWRLPVCSAACCCCQEAHAVSQFSSVSPLGAHSLITADTRPGAASALPVKLSCPEARRPPYNPLRVPLTPPPAADLRRHSSLLCASDVGVWLELSGCCVIGWFKLRKSYFGVLHYPVFFFFFYLKSASADSDAVRKNKR